MNRNMRKLVHSTYTVRTVKRGYIIFTVFSVKTTYTCRACHLAPYTAYIMAIHGSTGAERAQEVSDVWEALSLLWTRSAGGLNIKHRQSLRSVWHFSEELWTGKTGSSDSPSAQSAAAEQEPRASCPQLCQQSATCTPCMPTVHRPIAGARGSLEAPRAGKSPQPHGSAFPSRGARPKHCWEETPINSWAVLGFGRVLTVQCAKHSTARRSQCQCPGMFPGCISLHGASLCKSHCNKQIPLPKSNSFATRNISW